MPHSLSHWSNASLEFILQLPIFHFQQNYLFVTWCITKKKKIKTALREFFLPTTNTAQGRMSASQTFSAMASTKPGVQGTILPLCILVELWSKWQDLQEWPRSCTLDIFVSLCLLHSCVHTRVDTCMCYMHTSVHTRTQQHSIITIHYYSQRTEGKELTSPISLILLPLWM